MSFSGKSYAQYTIKRSLERHLSASLALRTLHPSGTIMFAAGDVDYSVLELVSGFIRLDFVLQLSLFLFKGSFDRLRRLIDCKTNLLQDSLGKASFLQADY